MNAHRFRRPDHERISIDELRRRFTYRNGELRRKAHGTRKKKTGSVNSNGYHRVKIDGKSYYTHHLVFAFHHGRWPIEVDHSNRNQLDNRIENLREVTRKENQANRGDYSWRATALIHENTNGTFYTRARIRGKMIFLGTFSTYMEALRARIMFMRENSEGEGYA